MGIKVRFGRDGGECASLFVSLLPVEWEEWFWAEQEALDC